MTPCIEHTQRGERYGRTRRKGRMMCLHVAVWEEAHGPVPQGWHVDHLCFNMRCVRLDHLEAVTPIENNRRRRNLKLNLALAEQIRAEYAALPRGTRGVRPSRPLKTTRPVRVASGARAALAARYGVTVETVRELVNGRTWVV